MRAYSGVFILSVLCCILCTGCQQTPPPPSGFGPQPAAPQTPPDASAQLLLINQATLPGFYAVCSLDGEQLPYKLSSGQYIERQLRRSGYHRVECAVETLSVQVSFDCDHSFEIYGDEPVYLSLTGRFVPGTCAIKRLSLLPQNFHKDYVHAWETIP